jgi:hypothetical protein
VRRRERTGGAAEAAIAAHHGRRRQAAKQISTRLVDDVTLRDEYRTFILALVEHAGHPRATDHSSRRRQRLENRDALFAVQYLLPVDAGARIADPESGIPQHHGHRRQRPQPALIDELKLAFVHRIRAAAEPEGIEHGVALGIGMLEIGEGPLQQGFGIDRHLRALP